MTMCLCKQQQHGLIPSWSHTATVLVGHAWMVLQLRNCYPLTKLPDSSPKQLCRAGVLRMPVCLLPGSVSGSSATSVGWQLARVCCRSHWAGDSPVCACVCVSPESHMVWLPGVTGARPLVPSLPKSPHQFVYPHPLLDWGPSATPQSWCQSAGRPGGQEHPGWAHEGWQSWDLQVSPPLCSLELCSVCVGEDPSQPWEHPALGCQLVLLQDPVLAVPTWPWCTGQGVFRARPSLSMSTSALKYFHPPRVPRALWGVGLVGHGE